MLRFSFSNLDLIPDCLEQESGIEKPEKFLARQFEIPGEQFIEPVEAVGCLLFIRDMEEAGYIIVDAFFKVGKKYGRDFGIMLFTFAIKENAHCSERFLRAKLAIEQKLHNLFEQNMWRVRAFLNPFFKNGKMIDDLYAVSVNFEVRTPLVDGNGKPLVQWQKNDKGERIGDAPIKICPKLFLRIENGDICAASA